MSADKNTPILSALAEQRRHTMLPGLLMVVRRRRQRRQLARAAAAVVLGAAVGVWQPWRIDEPESKARVAPAASWTAIGDDPTVLQRCEVATVSRAEWFVDDAGLQELLAQAARPAGLVRTAGQVLVDRQALDRWDTESP